MNPKEIKKLVKIIQDLGFKTWVFDDDMTEVEFAEEYRDAQAYFFEHQLGIKRKERE